MLVDERRGCGARLLSVLLWLLAVPFVALAVLRFAGFDGNRYTAAALALVPYATIGGLLLGGLALLSRRWWVGALVLGLAVALTVSALPRAFANQQPEAFGRTVRMASLNMYLGNVDARTVVDLVRGQRIEVLALTELTPDALSALDAAGLRSLLPHRVASVPGGPAGSGLFSVFPLDERSLAGPSRLAQPSARLRVPGVPEVEVVAVHPVPPVVSAGDWKAELAGLPRTDRRVLRVLLGDFNATFDHAAFREIVNSGYVDAGDQAGAGFAATWPRGYLPPPVTIDHILADNRVAVRDYRVLPVPTSDHDAVYAELTLPY